LITKRLTELTAERGEPDCWTSVHGQVDAIDALIEEFNAKVGLL
jgi:hypothetical protein